MKFFQFLLILLLFPLANLSAESSVILFAENAEGGTPLVINGTNSVYFPSTAKQGEIISFALNQTFPGGLFKVTIQFGKEVGQSRLMYTVEFPSKTSPSIDLYFFNRNANYFPDSDTQ
jgi:hypothetical protein